MYAPNPADYFAYLNTLTPKEIAVAELTRMLNASALTFEAYLNDLPENVKKETIQDLVRSHSYSTTRKRADWGDSESVSIVNICGRCLD